MQHDPLEDVLPEGKAIHPDVKNETVQVSAHLTKYQKEWIGGMFEDDEDFSMSGEIRKVLDVIIAKSDEPLPDDVLIDEEELQDEKDERQVLDAFITSE